jgi:nucleoside-diphosphate-sugar epimerase
VFLSSETKMPMMYMDDAIAATIQIMQAPAEQIKIRSSYNLAAMSFTPTEIAAEINTFLNSRLPTNQTSARKY